MAIALSVLDQSPIYPGETPAEAFAHTIQLARKSEELGFKRFWVSEHHDSEHLAGSSPEVLIAHLLAKTERIRIGSGGVMLQHYSPYKVAENFNVLAALAPGRVDLGIGRAPGGLPRSTRALQQTGANALSLTEKIQELDKFIHHRLEADHPFAGLKAAPIPDAPPELYLLGASMASAELAAQQGLPYVFSLFINSDWSIALEAIRAYRTSFNVSSGAVPRALLALAVVVADSEEEAVQLSPVRKLVKIHFASGRTLTVSTMEQVEEIAKQTDEAFTVEEKEMEVTKGTKETVRKQLLEFQQLSGVEEFIVTTNVHPFEKRLRSLALLSEALAEVPDVVTAPSVREEAIHP